MVVGTGDCAGSDRTETAGFAPVPSECNAASAGQIAVCWDSDTYNVIPDRIACTYKTLAPNQCSGGINTGLVHECRNVGGNSSSGGTSSSGSSVSPSNLAALWLFNNDLTDSSPNALDLIPNTGTITFQSVGGRDGVRITTTSMPPNVYPVRPTSDSALNFGRTNYTVAAWVYLHTFSSESPLVTKKGVNNSNGWGLFAQNGSRKLWWCVTEASNLTGEGTCVPGSPYLLESSVNMPVGAWTHIAVTRDSVTTKLFINGNVEDTQVNTETVNISVSESPLRIGTDSNSAFADATVDEVRIYQRALANAEVRTLAGAACGATASEAAFSCRTIREECASPVNGEYWVTLGAAPRPVHCNQTEHGGGWTLFARNGASDHFTWTEWETTATAETLTPVFGSKAFLQLQAFDDMDGAASTFMLWQENNSGARGFWTVSDSQAASADIGRIRCTNSNWASISFSPQTPSATPSPLSVGECAGSAHVLGTNSGGGNETTFFGDDGYQGVTGAHDHRDFAGRAWGRGALLWFREGPAR